MNRDEALSVMLNSQENLKDQAIVTLTGLLLKVEVELAELKRQNKNKDEQEEYFRKTWKCDHPFLPVGFEDGTWHCCECWALEEEARAEKAKAEIYSLLLEINDMNAQRTLIELEVKKIELAVKKLGKKHEAKLVALKNAIEFCFKTYQIMDQDGFHIKNTSIGLDGIKALVDALAALKCNEVTS
jgi:hypothetical protein